MPTYIALLRGINVSGQKIIPMERLRKSCEGLGFKNVQTYIQSGNILFQAPKSSPASLEKKIGAAILSDFGFVVPVIIRTPEELESVVKKNPFARGKSIDPARLFITFLSEAPKAAAAKNLASLPIGPDQFKLLGRELYLHCPNGFGKSKLAGTNFEKLLSVRVTARNWNTINKLIEMSYSPPKPK